MANGHDDKDIEGREDRAETFARRAILQAGWVVPTVLALQLPTCAGAASAHQDDTVPHSDATGPGGHGDIGGQPNSSQGFERLDTAPLGHDDFINEVNPASPVPKGLGWAPHVDDAPTMMDPAHMDITV